MSLALSTAAYELSKSRGRCDNEVINFFTLKELQESH